MGRAAPQTVRGGYRVGPDGIRGGFRCGYGQGRGCRMAGESLSFGDDACFEAAGGAEGVEEFGDVPAAGAQ
ncbi:hypothetical protein ADK52_38605 [Streptomyces sp. WM6372]|nr:hypothetical protein ADK52_38605 [Streptomyces sp. WM6372]